MLGEWKSASAYERICCCNMSLKHVQASFSQVCQLCYLVPTTQPSNMSRQCVCPSCILQQHVPATYPLVWAHLKKQMLFLNKPNSKQKSKLPHVGKDHSNWQVLIFPLLFEDYYWQPVMQNDWKPVRVRLPVQRDQPIREQSQRTWWRK